MLWATTAAATHFLQGHREKKRTITLGIYGCTIDCGFVDLKPFNRTNNQKRPNIHPTNYGSLFWEIQNSQRTT